MFEPGSKISIRSYDLQTVSHNLNKDTLWLVSKDYAAHCSITIFSPYLQSRLKDSTDAWGNPIYCVNVPRDYDGFWHYGLNIGDFMADAWEAKYVAAGQPIRDFFPFGTFGVYNFTRVPPDIDASPTGRNNPGDGLSNFEEYRGFMVSGDQFMPYTSQRHKRLDPNKKNAFLSFMPNVQPEVRACSPGYVGKLSSDTLVYTVGAVCDAAGIPVDTSKWFRDSTMYRFIDFNQWGAWYPYYSWPVVSRRPRDRFQKAVTFWRDYASDYPNGLLARLGKTRGYMRGSSFFTPNDVRNCVIMYSTILMPKNTPNSYYQNNPQAWDTESKIRVGATIAYEFGHAVGMSDFNDPNMMGKAILDMSGPGVPFRWAVAPPRFVADFADTSKKEYTIKRLR